jgi:hypothetical protein
VLVGNNGTILTSDNISSVEYSPLYNAETEFYVPSTESDVNFNQLDNNIPATQVSYIKAKL